MRSIPMTDRRFILGGIGLALAVTASAGPAAAQASSFIVSRAVSTAPPDHRVPAFGRVILDPQGQLDINAAISGQVAEVLVLPGSAVAKGDPIATVTSPDFVFTQRSYLALLENDEQLEILRGEGNLPNYLSDARDNLRWWGMTEAQIDRLVQERRTVDRLNLLAPEDGIITEVLVQPGDMIDAGDRTMQNFIVLGRAVARMQRAATPLVLEVAVFPDLDLGPADSLVVVSAPESAAEDAATPPGGGWWAMMTTPPSRRRRLLPQAGH
ncbi:hypothetical protein DIE28_02025 [Paracoccus thiocyanatus]|uniref:Uncharacterized protein n=2 Tax=Paracoccus thiocyanatus TaxID=34006 RepID=A0A3D8PH25_9RHOB|nr:hypothetical protein DIE28_02025 [Paracoccus thiocyanatus]